MESSSIVKASLVRMPKFRLNFSTVKLEQFFEYVHKEGQTAFFVRDGVKWEPIEKFFTIHRVDRTRQEESIFSRPSEEDVANKRVPQTIIFEGDLSRIDFLGFKNDGIRITVNGSVGNYLGCMMSGGKVVVNGSAGHYLGAMMSGGSLTVCGNIGNYAGSNLPGEMEGMAGGQLVVKGNAGNNFCRRMRRGFAFVHGDAGDFFANDLIAGTVGVAGNVGIFWGYGMRRGTIIFAKNQHIPNYFFKETHHEFPSFWGLLKPKIESLEGLSTKLLQFPPKRFVGDLAFGGKGECLLLGNGTQIGER